MQTGDIVFFKGDAWADDIIYKLTGSPYTHVAIAVNSTSILEVNRGIKVRVRSLGDREVYKVMRPKTPLTNDQRRGLLGNGLKLVGKVGYNYVDVVIWGLRLLTHWKIPFVDRVNSLYCSQLVDRLYLEIGIDLVPDNPTDEVLPSDLLKSPLLTDE